MGYFTPWHFLSRRILYFVKICNHTPPLIFGSADADIMTMFSVVKLYLHLRRSTF